MVIVLDIVPHRKDDLVTVETDFRIPGNALGNVDNRVDLTALGQIDRLHRTAAVEERSVDLAGLVHGGFSAVLVMILRPRDEQDRLAADQRIGDQGLTTQGLQFRENLSQVLRRCFGRELQELIELGKELSAFGITITKRGRKVFDSFSQRPVLLPDRPNPLLFGPFRMKGKAGFCGLWIEAALGLKVVQRNVSPTTRVQVDRLEKDFLSD